MILPLTHPLTATAASSSEIAYFLRRAEEESVAAIRASDPRVAERHGIMSRLYSAKSRTLMNVRDVVRSEASAMPAIG